MDSSLLHSSRISAAAERQMQTWVRLSEMAARAQNQLEIATPPAHGLGYVAVSREAGAGGATVAHLVGDRLGWEVYDGSLLDQVARRYSESRVMLDLVDESAGSWLYDVLGAWMDRRTIPHDKYTVQISRMIQVLARAGNAVFVGRGAQFLLPRSRTFSARLVASESYRAQRVAQRQGMTLPEAMSWVRHADRGRNEWVRNTFHRDITDSHLYDMVINVERVGASNSAEVIVETAKRVSA